MAAAQRRVAVLSAGVVSPAGVGWPDFSDRIFLNRDWFEKLPRNYPYPCAAPVEDSLLDAFYRRKGMRLKYRRYFNRAVDLGVAAAVECLEKPGLKRISREEVAVFWGAGPNFDPGWSPRNLLRESGAPSAGHPAGEEGDSGLQNLPAAWILFYLPNTAASAISAVLGTKGESLTYCSACAAASNAVGEAFLKIRCGHLDVVLCGGSDSRLSREGLLAYKMLGALSSAPEPKVLPMCAERDGFIPGEGAAAFLLADESTALSLGVPILGELAGYGACSDGFRLTDPEPEGIGMERAMRGALLTAGAVPDAVDAVNAHGTGTLMNDAAEAAAIRRLFGRPVPVTSNKSQFGHASAAAGAVELAACLAMLERNRITPTVNTGGKTVEKGIALVRESRPTAIDTILSNSFGFGGQNSSLIVRRWET